MTWLLSRVDKSTDIYFSESCSKTLVELKYFGMQALVTCS
jgi:hypothetical protein